MKSKLVTCINATGRLASNMKYRVMGEKIEDGETYYTVQERSGRYLPGWFLATRFRSTV